MNNRTLVKLACLALLLLPSLASADDAAKPFGGVHVGAAGIGPDNADDTNEGWAPFIDGEAGVHLRWLDLSAFGIYTTKHIDDEEPDSTIEGALVTMHYRMHLVDFGARIVVRSAAGFYAGVGVGGETVIERGYDHVVPLADLGFSGPPYNRSHHAMATHPAYELRAGYTGAYGIDVFASLTRSSDDYETRWTGRLGVGYRF